MTARNVLNTEKKRNQADGGVSADTNITTHFWCVIPDD